MSVHAIELAPGVVLEPQGWAARLGRALHDAREQRSVSLRALARESGGRFSVSDLRAFERGRRPAGEQLGETLAHLYQLDLASVMPPSRAIEIDLERCTVSAGGAVTQVRGGEDATAATLSAYLELVWALRGTSRSVVPLRTGDVAVLAEALSLDEDTVVGELAELMRCSPAEARRILAALRTRAFAVPASAVLLLAGGAIAGSQVDAHIPGMSPGATKRLYGYDWPGNVRQLRNAVETMVVLDVDGTLDLDDLPPELADAAEIVTPVAIGGGPMELIGRPMDDIERWAIEETLKLTSGNREEAAKILGIGARTLYRKLEKYQTGQGEMNDES